MKIRSQLSELPSIFGYKPLNDVSPTQYAVKYHHPLILINLSFVHLSTAVLLIIVIRIILYLLCRQNAAHKGKINCTTYVNKTFSLETKSKTQLSFQSAEEKFWNTKHKCTYFEH